MEHYFFIQSEDPFTRVQVLDQFELAAALVAAGHQVSMLLVQNGVTVARKSSRAGLISGLLDNGVRLLADRFSLAQREIGAAQLIAGIEKVDLDTAIDALLNGDKVIWN